MADVVGAGSIGCESVEMKGQEFAEWRVGCVRAVGLLKGHALIGESTHAAVASEVVIERAVFLNKDHHMIDVR